MLHFTREEFLARQRNAIAAMQARNLDGLLIFRQESMYYLTGYDTMGFSQFQCLYMGADGRLMLLTRSADLRQARLTSTIEDIRVWVDRADSNPGLDLRSVLEEIGLSGRRLGVELDAYSLTGQRWDMVRSALEGFCSHEDASGLVNRLRLVKSAAELAYVRRAAELGDDALEEANRLAVPGASEQDVLAAMHSAIFRGGGDYPASRFIIGAGESAMMVRNFTGYGTLGDNDQLQLEFGGAFRHYHSCLMRTVLTGRPNPQQVSMHSACVEALQACQEAARPGVTFGEVFDVHARVLDAAGFGEHRLNACGYSLGALYPPTWMDWPMLYADNPIVIQPNMVIFMHMILLDSQRGLAMSLGETSLITETGCERLSRMSLDLVVN
ncbi:MAG: Xaa-Pro peptidase family protein [SAR202 cluster bacterium]|jgi:Xaa-Pro dipeptidase|nr:Xaa-Pro peptidase family protein [SAR202 cluster bacterium]MDP6512112.1 Xaa-Pro peptidase family protein [SAR202 cluster bacterium]MDP6714422.1 Xaa-Pro peptidase family protein [SAR202 cluster bacterium]